jgi:hypothetical protein
LAFLSLPFLANFKGLIYLSLWKVVDMSGETERAYGGKCIDCASRLVLYEVDFECGRRIMQCTRCGLYHFYKKDFFGNWKLVKAGRVSDLWKNPK